MRRRFDEQLMDLNSNLIEMGALVERAIARATKALEDQDVSAAKQIIEDDSIIDEKEKDIESRCLKLLLHQQPVAGDLRLVSTALKMITDMERIGDHATDISELCLYLSGQKYLKTFGYIREMSMHTIKMLTLSIDSYVRKDLALAGEVIKCDDIVDELYMTIKRELIASIHEDAENGEQALDILQIAKYYERIGDHAVNLAHWAIFSITGMHKNTQVI